MKRPPTFAYTEVTRALAAELAASPEMEKLEAQVAAEISRRLDEDFIRMLSGGGQTRKTVASCGCTGFFHGPSCKFAGLT